MWAINTPLSVAGVKAFCDFLLVDLEQGMGFRFCQFGSDLSFIHLHKTGQDCILSLRVLLISHADLCNLLWGDLGNGCWLQHHSWRREVGFQVFHAKGSRLLDATKESFGSFSSDWFVKYGVLRVTFLHTCCLLLWACLLLQKNLLGVNTPSLGVLRC